MSEQLRLSEKEAIEAELQACRGRVSRSGGAAQRLGVPASTLEFRIRKLAID
ncbi:MAG TPA: helix-turn-helix domain-containing protein [Bryobacteraceae bacterium]|jgi:DNA-binding NtrC family response regulator